MRKRFLQILLVAAAATLIGCSQSSCRSLDAGEYPYQGPIIDEHGQPVPPPDWDVRHE